MSLLALVLYCALIGIILGGRLFAHRLRFGRFAWVGGAPGNLLGTGAVVLAGVAMPIALFALHLDWVLGWESPRWLQLVGVLLWMGGLFQILRAQEEMGASWRFGVSSEKTELITSGPFRRIRNPIYTWDAVATFGVVLLAPSLSTVGAWAVLLLGFQLKVRGAEEPAMAAAHGVAWQHYFSETGRFFPPFKKSKKVGNEPETPSS